MWGSNSQSRHQKNSSMFLQLSLPGAAHLDFDVYFQPGIVAPKEGEFFFPPGVGCEEEPFFFCVKHRFTYST